MSTPRSCSVPCARRLRDRRGARRRGRRDREHLLVHPERARGVGAGDPRARRLQGARRDPRAGRDRLPAPALRRGPGEGAARGRRVRGHRPVPEHRGRSSTRRVPGRSNGVYVDAGRTHLYDEIEPAAPDRRAPQRLPEDRRGLRPRVRVLRDPRDSRQLPEPHARPRSWPRRASSRSRACARST